MRLTAVLNILLVSLTVALALDSSSPKALADDTPAAAAPQTEDVVFMRDGRELHGQIINETRSLIIFEYIDTTLKTKTKLTLLKDDVVHIDRKVEVKADAATEQPKPAVTTSTKKAFEPERTYGTSLMQNVATVPSVYIVPMKGQMGTDVNAEIYKKVIDDIREIKPDVVVIEIDCQDTEDVVYNAKGREEQGLVDIDQYRELVALFRDQLPGVHQVCWVHDSVGISSMVALAWHEMFMKPNARLGGLIVAKQMTGFDRWSDEDVRGKMTAAFMAWVKGFLESGRYSLLLADAMVRPNFMLSATWKGREVIWSLDDKGQYLVDGSDKRTVEFRAKDAEDFCISKGTAETLDDLALLLGYREYRLADGAAEKLCADYIRDWRRCYEDAKTLLVDAEQYKSWASGQDAVKYLGKTKAVYEKIVGYMDRFKPVEIRLGQEYGIKKQDLIVQIELIKEQLRAMKRSTAGPTGGGRSSGGGAMGGR